MIRLDRPPLQIYRHGDQVHRSLASTLSRMRFTAYGKRNIYHGVQVS